jgi:hypothetical protein
MSALVFAVDISLIFPEWTRRSILKSADWSCGARRPPWASTISRQFTRWRRVSPAGDLTVTAGSIALSVFLLPEFFV